MTDTPEPPAEPLQAAETLEPWETETHVRAAQHGGLMPLEGDREGPWNHARLPKPEILPPLSPHADAEAALTALIGECRLFMREIAFHSARLSPGPSDRIAFINAAGRLARDGAKVGLSVACLRAAAGAEPLSR